MRFWKTEPHHCPIIGIKTRLRLSLNVYYAPRPTISLERTQVSRIPGYICGQLLNQLLRIAEAIAERALVVGGIQVPGSQGSGQLCQQYGS